MYAACREGPRESVSLPPPCLNAGTNVLQPVIFDWGWLNLRACCAVATAVVVLGAARRLRDFRGLLVSFGTRFLASRGHRQCLLVAQSDGRLRGSCLARYMPHWRSQMGFAECICALLSVQSRVDVAALV